MRVTLRNASLCTSLVAACLEHDCTDAYTMLVQKSVELRPSTS